MEEENKEVEEKKEKSKKEMLDELLREEMEGYDPEDVEGSSEMLMNYINAGRDSRGRMAEALNKDPRLAQVFADVAGGKRGAADAFVRYFGKDFLSAEEGSPEYEAIAAAEKERKEEMDKISARGKEYETNIAESEPKIKAWAESKGYDMDEFLEKVWEKVVNPIVSGIYTEELLDLLDKGMNYDKDTADAMEAGKVAGRNEKIERMREEREGDGMPKNVGNGTPAESGKKKENKKMSFLEMALKA